MSTISASTTSNTAFKVTSDTTGTLVLQTGAVPTTAISISASQVVSIGSIAVTGVTTFSAGSAAAPSITTTGDTNTGIFFPAADTIAFTEGGVESMRINSSGNLGLGVTPSPWDTLTAFDIGAGGGVWGTAAQAALGSNVYFVNPNFKYKQTNVAAALQIDGNIFKFFNAPSGSANATISFTQAMTLDASGHLYPDSTVQTLGTSAKRWGTVFATALSDGGDQLVGSSGTTARFGYGSGWTTLAFATGGAERARITSDGDLCVQRTTSTFSSSNRGNITIGGTAGSILFLGTGSSTGSYIFHEQSTASLEVWNTANSYTRFGTNAVERARITSAGDLGVGTSSPTTGSLSNTATLNAGLFATLRGTIASTSGVAVTIGTALSSTNVGYIVSCGVASADPANYCAVAVVSADSGVLRVTALQTAVLMSISVSGTSIRATQSSGGAQTLFFNILRIS